MNIPKLQTGDGWDIGWFSIRENNIDVEPHERVLRRLLRDVTQRGGDLEGVVAWDVTQRGGDLEGVVAWYRRDVIPNFPVYTEPCKAYADLVVPFLDENPVALQPLVAGLRDWIVNQCSSVQLGL